MTEQTYKAFISYSHADESWARWLHRRLEAYRPPRALEISRRLKPIFRDRDELAASRDLSETIETALRSSKHLIVICSPAAATSRWVSAEIERFIALGRDTNIHCLIVDGLPGDPEQECLPVPLRDTEPLAADIRSSADGPTGALLKLAAALLGVSYDTLRRRDARRRQRRMLAITSASLAGMLVALTLAVTAINARDQARSEAQKASLITGFLIDVFKLADPAETRRRDMSAKELLLEGAAEIPVRFADQADVLVDLSTEVGAILESYAEYPRAEQFYRQAAEYASHHFGEQSLEHAGALRSLARTYLFQDRYAESIELQRRALLIDELLREPDDPGVGDALAELSGTMIYAGDFGAEATTLLERAQHIYERSDLPDNEDAIVVEFRLAGLYREQGRSEEALALYSSCLTRLERIGARPDRRAMVLTELGSTLEQVGSADQALGRYDEAIEIMTGLYGEDHPGLANVWMFKAHLLVSMEDSAAARVAIDNSERIGVAALGPDSDLVSTALEARARLWLLEGRADEAVALMAGLVQRWTASVGRDHVDTASAMALHAQALQAAGEHLQAVEAAESALAVMRAQLAPDHPRIVRAQEILLAVRQAAGL